MATFPYKAAKQLSLLCASFAFLSLVPSSHPTQDAQFLKRMKAYWKEGDFETAKRQIRSYLESNKNTELCEELHLLLGDLYLKDGNFASSLEEYEQITKKELKEKVFYNKVLCLYELEKTQELADISDIFASYPGLSTEQKNSICYLCGSSLFNYLISTDDKDPAVLERTQELFQACKGTSFESLSFYPLAKLYEISQNKTQAAVYYEAAAKLNPEKASDFLFQAAFLQSETAPNLAIQNFLKVLSFSSGKKSSALYNCLLLQYQTNQFGSLVSTYETYHGLLEKNHQTSASYLFGKSLYQLENFERAVEPLLNSLNASLPIASQKTAQLMILKCAHKMQNEELYHKVFRNPNYPLVNDPSYATAHLVYLDLLKTSGHYPEFVEESKMFVMQNPGHVEKEKILWDTAYFLYQDKRWDESDKLFSKLLIEHPSTPSKNSAWRLRLNCSLAELQASSPEMIHTYRNQFIEKARIALKEPDVLNKTERETFSFEVIKNLFLEEKFPETLDALSSFLQESPSNRFGNDLQLIQTLCYLSDPNATSLFVEQAESLLKNQPEISQGDKIRLHLFNSYIQLAENKTTQEKQELFNHAAGHLYSVFQKQTATIQPENLEWLAQHYYLLSKNMQTDLDAPQNLKASYQGRSIELLELLLSRSKETLDKEAESNLFKLCEVLSWAKQPEKKTIILNQFLTAQAASTSVIQRQLFLELAQTYTLLGDSVKALDLYSSLIQNFPESQIKALAVLDRSKLLLTYLPEEQKTEENSLFLQNLNDLKDLEVQKSLLSEPLHLEAGLEYIHWKASLDKDFASQQEKKLALLRLFKENFQSELQNSTQGDSIDGVFEEKKELLTAYLKFAEAEILHFEACLMENQTDAKVLAQKAYTKMEDLLTFTSLPKNLKERVLISKQELSKIL